VCAWWSRGFDAIAALTSHQSPGHQDYKTRTRTRTRSWWFDGWRASLNSQLESIFKLIKGKPQSGAKERQIVGYSSRFRPDISRPCAFAVRVLITNLWRIRRTQWRNEVRLGLANRMVRFNGVYDGNGNLYWRPIQETQVAKSKGVRKARKELNSAIPLYWELS